MDCEDKETTKESESIPTKSDAQPLSNDLKPDDEVNEATSHYDESNTNNDTQPSSSSWWNWVESAKEKSSEAYQFMKRDLSELRDSVSSDTSNIVAGTANIMSGTVSYMKDAIVGIGQMVLEEDEEQVKEGNSEKERKLDNSDEELVSKREVKSEEEEDVDELEKELSAFTSKAKEKLSAIFETIGSAFIVNRNYDDDDELIVMGDGHEVPIERWKTLLRMIQTDPHTYYHEPDGPPEDYETWLASFNLIDYQSHMTHLLETIVEMNEFYCQLVPHSLSDVEFWHRYYYKVHQLRDLERKRASKISSLPTRLESANDALNESTSTSNANKAVQIKCLREASGDESVKSEGSTSSPQSSDAKHSDSDWEKADLSDGLEDLNKKVDEKLLSKDDDNNGTNMIMMKSEDDWVKLIN